MLLRKERDMYRAFQGANWWYVAWEDDEGFHRQPAHGGNLGEAYARQRAKERNEEQEDDDHID